MSVLVTAFLLVILNVLAILILNLRFKSMFSNEKILKETREACNSMIMQINANADRNLQLLNDKIRELKSCSADVERKIAQLKSETEFYEKNIAFQQKNDFLTKIETSSSKKKSKSTQDEIQGELFITQKGRDELGIGEEKHSDTYQRIPVVHPEIFESDTPVVPHKDFRTTVKEFYSKGYTAEMIAQETGRSIQEVNLVLQFM